MRLPKEDEENDTFGSLEDDEIELMLS